MSSSPKKGDELLTKVLQKQASASAGPGPRFLGDRIAHDGNDSVSDIVSTDDEASNGPVRSPVARSAPQHLFPPVSAAATSATPTQTPSGSTRRRGRKNSFRARPSQLDYSNLEREDNPMRGFFVLFWIFMVFYVLITIYTNWSKGAAPIRLDLIHLVSRDGISLALADLALICSCAMVVVIMKLVVWGIIPRFLALTVQHSWQTLWYFSCIGYVFYKDWPWVQSGFFVLHATAMLMKQHSYISTNLELFDKSRHVKKLQNERDILVGIQKRSGDHDETGDEKPAATAPNATPDAIKARLDEIHFEIYGLYTELHKPAHDFPKNINLMNFIDYMAIPTLVYELEYPRTSEIRFIYVFEKICATLGTFGLILFIVDHYIYPVLYTMKTLSYLDTFAGLLMPFMVCYILVFFIIFECICNGFAELTRFADRRFYDDWWNSASFDEFARRWNRPVHEFLLRHVYFESIQSFKISKTNATYLVFFLSSCIHELVFAVVGRRLRLYLFLMQMFQLPLIWLGRQPIIKQNRTLGNIIFWIGMFLGPPLLAVLYAREHFLN
ncbi:MBOAT, membrane-bound O-acyltransferase family-domain-containing protein [Polychytrium aggregatum]|uniref:MBOAT, membrane-bound O-acyltransferase family-domain-containing protein n=1 Tax=Polychytrium aggregatum TaxID=110093 RepID=UPI0022FEA3C1|nr:MBOAT, membrane-bound O-acyltransferase family-domain-containing protein [Polychytrium aggregatum]KAI9207743.1 MBOAT, membrane-bound O-acyltransferase family-domain-containing protein [Polychytrium aggregatum]